MNNLGRVKSHVINIISFEMMLLQEKLDTYETLQNILKSAETEEGFINIKLPENLPKSIVKIFTDSVKDLKGEDP